VGLFSLVYGFTEAARAKHPEDPSSTQVLGWTAPSTIAFLAAAVVLLVAFVLWERRAANPMLPLRIVLDRNRGGSYLVFLLVGAGLFAMFLFLTYYFQINLGYSPVKSGFAFLPFSVGIILAAGVVAQLLPRIGPKPILLVGLTLATSGMLLLTRVGNDTSYLTHVLPSEVLLSIGMACVFIPASNTALHGVGSHDAGVASAVLNTSQQIGGSLGTALLNTLFAATVTGYLADNVKSPDDAQRLLPLAFIDGYHVAFFWAAMLLAGALLVALFVINARKQVAPEPEDVEVPSA
jgi:predicted MFS family arabinose efflux permease